MNKPFKITTSTPSAVLVSFPIENKSYDLFFENHSQFEDWQKKVDAFLGEISWHDANCRWDLVGPFLMKKWQNDRYVPSSKEDYYLGDLSLLLKSPDEAGGKWKKDLYCRYIVDDKGLVFVQFFSIFAEEIDYCIYYSSHYPIGEVPHLGDQRTVDAIHHLATAGGNRSGGIRNASLKLFFSLLKNGKEIEVALTAVKTQIKIWEK